MSARGATAVNDGVERTWFRVPASGERGLRDNLPTGLPAGPPPRPGSVHGDRRDGLSDGARGLRGAEVKQDGMSTDKSCEAVTDGRGGATLDKPVSASQGGALTFMSPIFHFTAHDITITAMEHNNHCKLLALATSRNEIYITQTLVMPVMESLGLTSADLDPLNSLATPSSSPPPRAPPIDVRLLDWSPAEMTTLVDRLGSPCVQLQWAPWQHGVYLAALCSGRHIRLYRYSHDRWALDTVMPCPGCLHFAFSAHFTIACACGGGGVDLLAPSVAQTQDEHAWTVCSTLRGAPEATPSPRNETGTVGQNQASAQGSSQDVYDHGSSSTVGALYGVRDAVHGDIDGVKSDRWPSLLGRQTGYVTDRAGCLCVAWDDSGSLLGVGRQDGRVDVFWVGEQGRKLGSVAFSVASGPSAPPSLTRRGGRCSQVAWSPSSGRSFLALAVAHASRLSLMLFARPRQLSLAGLPLLAAATGRQETVGVASSQPALLRLLASTTMICKGIVRLAWNTTGTRFVTSHVDNTVRVWSMCVRHVPEMSPSPPAAAANAAANSTTTGTTMATIGGGTVAGGSDGVATVTTMMRVGEADMATASSSRAAVMGGLAETSQTAWRMGADGATNVTARSGPRGGAGGGRAMRGFTLSVSIEEVTSVHPYHAVNVR